MLQDQFAERARAARSRAADAQAQGLAATVNEQTARAEAFEEAARLTDLHHAQVVAQVVVRQRQAAIDAVAEVAALLLRPPAPAEEG